ncbi:peptidogalycan biosysnthesis protein [Streptomyces sp. NPDC056883]|uniref:peptidogalycan biosysnthesis protein n=1 Tax=Streptomyces sp. NPDC056883 TaxID=3345959 RepID=UPI0036B94F03
MAVRTFDTMAEARVNGWEDLSPSWDLFHSAHWLALEGEQTNIAPRFHLAGEEGGRPEAALAGFPLDETSEPWPFMRVDCVLRLLADRWNAPVPDGALDPGRLLPTYLGGSRRVPDTLLLTDPHSGTARRRVLTEQLVAAAEEEARDRGSRSVAYLYVGEDDPLRDVLRGRGYAEFPTARYATLHLPKPGFDSYLDSLPGARRRKVVKERRLLEGAGLDIDVRPLTGELIPELVPLMIEHGGKYGHSYAEETLTRSLDLHVRHCGDTLYAITARSVDGVLRGFSAFVHRGSRLYLRQTGYDYDWLGKLPLYFELAFYAPIEYAARVGATAVDYAVESEQTKLSRGCTLEQRHGYLKLFDAQRQAELEPLLEGIRRGAVQALS